MDWLYSDGRMIMHYEMNKKRYVKEHPGELVIIDKNLKEYFFKTEYDMEKFFNPEKIEAIKKGEKPKERKIIFGTPPLCKKIPDPNLKQLKQQDLPLEFRL